MKTIVVSTQIFNPNWRALCGDRHWLPHIFAGKFVSATFWFDKKDKLTRHQLMTTTLLY